MAISGVAETMLPILLDHKILSNLPLPTDKAVNRVFHTFQAIIGQQTIPYFRNSRGIDLNQLSILRQNLSFRRMDDEENRIALSSLLVRSKQNWTVLIHEKLFDYLASILGSRPGLSLSSTLAEERKMMVFSEFLLRHVFEHLLFPKEDEYEVVRSDIAFAMELSQKDPDRYEVLRRCLQDGTNGILGKNYVALMNRAAQGTDCDLKVARIVTSYLKHVSELPGRFLVDIFRELNSDAKMRVLSHCYRGSSDGVQPLVRRAASLRTVLRLFSVAVRDDPGEGFELFRKFRKKWGVEALFHELDVPEEIVSEKSLSRLYDIFSKSLEDFVEPGDIINQEPSAMYSHTRAESIPQQPKTLKERIEEAKADADVPRPVIELIEKNKMNAAGQSGAKYTELIETLLAIPWGKIKRIWVSPEEFEDGLNRSHYGLKKPKELLADFFANLIWRYQHFKESEKKHWHRTGSALLLVGPPGVGKTSLAISVARNLGIPYHKLSLGGMKDEADIRGYGFTYEGSKPGPIIQGLVKMGVMNGMFIMDEADKTEKLAIATLLEILDPEQNHLFHDKYTQSTVDIDLSNCHFVLTANSIDNVPPAIINRCEVIFLDRYSVEEKISIARDYLIQRIRERYLIGADEISFDPDEETDILRHLIRNYTFEAGVRDLERVIRALFLRVQRKEIMGEGRQHTLITMPKITKYLSEPNKPRLINPDDRVGEMMGLGVNMEMGVGTLIPIQVTPLKSGQEKRDGRGYMSMVHATGNIERVMDESRKVASTAILHRAKGLGLDSTRMSMPLHLHFMGGSTRKDGPSAGSAIALALASLFKDRKIRRDVAMTGEVDTQGRITGVGGILLKLETAYATGVRTLIIPKENLTGNDSVERLPDSLKNELQILTYKEWKEDHEPFDYYRHVLQVVAVDDIVQAADIAFIDQDEIDSLETLFEEHARKASRELALDEPVPFKRLLLIYVDDPADIKSGILKSGVLESGFCLQDYGCILMVRKELQDDMAAQLPQIREMMKIREFDHLKESFVEVLEQLKNEYTGPDRPPLRISIIAPLPFMRREGLRGQDFPPEEGFAGLRIFSSCCTVENAQIHTCRKLLSKAYLFLARLSDDLLHDCPFLAETDGIYSTTISFIPEKYRLTVKRAEEILDNGISKWLEMMQGEADEEAETIVPCGPKL